MHIKPTGQERPTIAQLLDGDVAAIDEFALGLPFKTRSAEEHAPKFRAQDGQAAGAEMGGMIGVLPILGPLVQRSYEDWFGYVVGYDSIVASFARLAADPRVGSIVLDIDSPGGETAGLNEAVRRMTELRDSSGKTVVAVANELAASAAYALALVANGGIFAPASARLGSIGCVAIHLTRARMLQENGVDVTVFRSGKRKYEGNNLEPLTDEARAEMQKRIDTIGRDFAAQVAAAREIDVASVMALEGACLSTKDAVKAGLANGVGSFEHAVNAAQKAARTRQRDKSMKSIAAKLGLPETASETEIENAVAALQADHGKLISTVGAKDATEAFAKIQTLQVTVTRTISVFSLVGAKDDADAEVRIKGLLALTSAVSDATGKVDVAEQPGALKALTENAKRAAAVDTALAADGIKVSYDADAGKASIHDTKREADEKAALIKSLVDDHKLAKTQLPWAEGQTLASLKGFADTAQPHTAGKVEDAKEKDGGHVDAELEAQLKAVGMTKDDYLKARAVMREQGLI